VIIACNIWLRSLLFGRLTAADYEDAVLPTAHRRLRAKIECIEEPRFTPITTIPTSAPRNSLRMELNTTILEETVEYPSAIAAAAKRDCLCSSKNSKPTCAAAR